MVTSAANGSQTATIGTEHSLDTRSSAGVYQLVVDVSNLASGATPDIVTFNIYSKARSSDSEVLLGSHTLIGAQTVKLWKSPPYGVGSADFTSKLKQVQGTGRAFPWEVDSY
ncbi:MAG: hypothetical protein K8U57_07460 [Planctomycetes bacterium]|nr:hypothetical protein [Planctomycetota bacterium]